ncbi:hypothetical protein I2709_001232 [Vibrio mimicus]|uniref:Uncharacterized protein n=1 Tax=Vibrio aestuarianus TaxID=28171 RepID=A0AAX3U7R6_9VIBR|nr:hypothetical protein [Vibrio aestuarianus]WGK83047.1 hypothetical protein PYE51_16890 [Vibrio aestuarianus]
MALNLLIIIFAIFVIFAGVLYAMYTKNIVSKEGKTTIFELFGIFASIATVLAFLFSLSVYDQDKKERLIQEQERHDLIVSDFIASYQYNERAIEHFLETKVPERGKEVSLVEHSYFVSLEETQFNRILESGIIKDKTLFNKTLSLSEAVKKYNRDLAKLADLNDLLSSRDLGNRTMLLMIMKRDVNQIVDLYSDVAAELKESSNKLLKSDS